MLSVQRLAEPVTWEVAVAAWLAACQALGRSPSTVESYRGLLLGERLTRAQGARPWPLCLSREALVDYLLLGQREGLSPGTLRCHAGWLHAFTRWCCDMGYASEEQATSLRVRRPGVPRTLPEVLSDSQLQRLLRAASRPRDRMLVRVLVGTGLRLSECAALTLDDIGPELVRVRQGKGRKDRMVPLGLPGEPLSTLLNSYIAEDRPQVAERERRLWLSDYPPHRPLAAMGVWRVVSKLSHETGIRVHPHLLRHTWATRAIAAGIPTEIVRRAGGWASLQVMQRYLHVSDREMLAAWQAADSHELTPVRDLSEVALAPLSEP